MADTNISVACIGLGRMGAGIAHNIQRAGLRLIVYNRTHEKTEPFIACGAALARTPREAAQEADVVVTSLMDDASVLEVVDGADGVLAGMRPGAVHVGTTTTSPSLSTRLTELHASQGSEYVAAHVLGRPDAAAAGKLITLLAGTPEAIERALQVIDTYSARVILLGEDPALASSMKLAGNFFLAGLLEVIGEAFAFAKGRGVLGPFSEMLKAFLPGSQEYLDRISISDFDRAGFTLDAGLKDIRLILDAAAEVRVPLPCGSLIMDKCMVAQARGLNQCDWSVFTAISPPDAG
jgi:3-hydroxyisobutyrate dehydrogenase-like beta-hydroxyacid dehydrogenase